MNTTPPHIEFVVWDDDHNPAYLADSRALVRWAQAHQRSIVIAWRLRDDTCSIERRALQSEGPSSWVLTDEQDNVIEHLPADPSSDPRTLAVVDYVESHIAGPLIPLRTAPSDWDPSHPTDTVGTYARFGFLPPQPEGRHWVWRYCPDIIAAQSASLSDQQFEAYLNQVDCRVSMALVHSDDYPLDKLERVIHDTIYSAGPDLTALLDDVQMRVLDE